MVKESGLFLDPRLESIETTYRDFLKTPKPYDSVTFGALVDRLQTIKEGFRSGETAVYLGVYPYRKSCLLGYPAGGTDLLMMGSQAYATEEWIWPMYDIDGHEKTIGSAIERGKKVLQLLQGEGLAEHTEWILTGTGFRCVFRFLMPISFKAGWVEHLRSLNKDGFGVDPGPYHGSGAGGTPIRLLSYRNNMNQCRESAGMLDRHSALVDRGIISSLTESEYLKHTKGKPDPDDYIRMIRKILPQHLYDTGPKTPGEVVKFLDLLKSHGREAMLRKNIRTGKRFPRHVTIQIKDVFEHLDKQGIEYEEKRSDGVWSLSECPCCGQTDGHGYLLDKTGMLRCFSDSCRARRGDGGLMPTQWMGGAGWSVQNKKNAEVKRTIAVSKEEAEKKIVEHLSGSSNLALAVTPGVGKTHVAIEKAMSQAEQAIVIFAMPEHALAEEWAKKIQGRNPGVSVCHFKGRERHGDCERATRVKDASAKGFHPSQVVCFQCRLHPENTMSTSVCKYYGQFEEIRARKHGLILCTTHQLPYLVNDNVGKIKTIFVDEQALQAIVQKEKSISIHKLLTVTPSLSRAAWSLVHKIVDTTEDLEKELSREGEPHSTARLYTADPAGTWWQNKRLLWDACGLKKDEARSILGPEIDRLLSHGQYDQFRGLTNRKAMLWLQTALKEDGIAWIQADNSSHQSSLCYIKKLSLPKDITVVVLDATVSPAELRALFDRDFDFLELNVGWEGRRIHIRKLLGKHQKKIGTDKQFRSISNLLKKYIGPSKPKWLLCTHQADESQTLQRLRQEIPEVEWMSSHYFAERGKNEYENVDGVFCYGLPVWNPDEMQEYAAYLFPGDHTQQIKWIEEQNAAEILQKAHRARFIRHPGKTLIVAGYHWPDVLGKPDKVIDLTRSGDYLAEALERALVACDAIGFFDRQVAALVGIGMKGDDSKLVEIQSRFKSVAEVVLKSDIKVYPALRKLLSNAASAIFRTPPIVLPNRNTWKKLLTLIENKGGIKPLEVKLSDWGSTWTNGIGRIEDAAAFYSELSRATITAGAPFRFPVKEDMRELEQPAGQSDKKGESLLGKCA